VPSTWCVTHLPAIIHPREHEFTLKYRRCRGIIGYDGIGGFSMYLEALLELIFGPYNLTLAAARFWFHCPPPRFIGAALRISE
jgi:hypothetical protein